MPIQIIAMGGGGFSMEPDNPRLDRYIVEQAQAVFRTERPKVCFLAQASAEPDPYILNFYRAFTKLNCIPSSLSLFRPHTSDIAGFLGEQHAIYVGGGNTKSMLALWREWGLDTILRDIAVNGTILSGISAGAICWFEVAASDSIPGRITALKGLGYLAGACTPHYDGEADRRPNYERMIAAGDIPDGYAFDDGAQGHFIDGTLTAVVSSRPNAKGYRVEREGDTARETVLETRYLDF